MQLTGIFIDEIWSSTLFFSWHASLATIIYRLGNPESKQKMASCKMIADDSEENKCDEKVCDAFLSKCDQDQRNLSFIKSVVLSPHGHLKKRTEHCFRNLPGLPAAEDLHSKGNVIACSIVPPSNDKKTHFFLTDLIKL